MRPFFLLYIYLSLHRLFHFHFLVYIYVYTSKSYYIIPGIPPMPPIPGMPPPPIGGIPPAPSSDGKSVIIHSLVAMILAIPLASTNPVFTTFVGSMIPSVNISTY